MVGTPAAKVTSSPRIRFTTSAACGLRPGNTSLPPNITPANGSPQALTWNIGTNTSALSCCEKPITSAMPMAMVCRYSARWL